MTTACTINSVDIATLGALILRGGDHDLISFPARKEPVIIEWPDRDGFEIGDDEPVFDAKKVTIDYHLKGDETNFLNRLNAFANLHFQATDDLPVYVREFNATFNLRFTGISKLDINRGITRTGEKAARISVNYMMDDPAHPFNPAQTTPTADREPETQVTIDTVDLAAFGIIVKNVYSSALRFDAKPGIVYKSRYATGNNVIYPSVQKQNARKITLNCAMVCAGRTGFLENWNALWYAAALQPSVTLGLTAAGKNFTAYYTAMDNFNKRPWTRRAFAEFELLFSGYEI